MLPRARAATEGAKENSIDEKLLLEETRVKDPAEADERLRREAVEPPIWLSAIQAMYRPSLALL